MLNKRVQSEIDSFFAKLYDLPEHVRKVTSSAFTQCRDKISFTAFSTAHESLVDYFYNNFTYTRFHGLRLIAIDGSVYTLPNTPQMIEAFGENVLSQSGKWIKAQITFACDVLNNICVDACIAPYKESEAKLALSHISKLGKNNLLLFDRGYFGRTFLKAVVKSGNQSCFRVQKNACSEIIDFIKSNLTDAIVYIDVEGEKVKVRLSKILLDTGEEEYLATSLFDTKVFTLSRLKSLYHLRWGVEEQYKDMKYAISVENFIGKKPNSIRQEFYANILTYNLAMMSLKPQIDKASKKGLKKHKYKTNKKALLAKVKQCFVSLFFGVEKIIHTLNAIISAVKKESIPIRNGRKYPRSTTRKAKRKTHRAYIPVT